MSIQRYACYFVEGVMELNPRDDGEYVRFDEHEQEVDSLKTMLNVRTIEIANEEKMTDVLHDDNAALRAQVADLEQRLDRALNRLNDANCKRSMLIDENSELRSRIAMMRSR